jgi:hypothetical protein
MSAWVDIAPLSAQTQDCYRPPHGSDAPGRSGAAQQPRRGGPKARCSNPALREGTIRLLTCLNVVHSTTAWT